MKYAALLLAVSTLAACQAPGTAQKTDRVKLTQCGDVEITRLAESAPDYRKKVWVNGVEFGSEENGEIARNEYMPFHTYLYASTTLVDADKPYNIAAVTAAPDGVSLLRYRDSTEVGRDKCDTSEAALKAQLHDSSKPY
jgi:hypothetical protein